MSRATLRSQANRILIATFTILVVGSGAAIFGYAHVHEATARKQATEDAIRNLANQIDDLIPSFLLPEQKDGTSLILDRIKTNEELSSIGIIDESTFANLVQNCRSVGAVSVCDGTNEIKVAAPVRESGKIYGYLVKAKQANHVASAELVRTFLMANSLLFVAFLILFLMLAKLLRQIPSELDALVTWIDEDLSGNHLEIPKFSIGELHELSSKISDVIDRHDRARDQAVIGQLTSGIMHDIKTPLASLVAATCLVQEQAKDSPKRLSRLENLFTVCEARLHVVGDIIESTLDGSREIHIEKANQCVKRTIRHALQMTSELVQGRRGMITFDEPTNEVFAHHDSVQIGRILTNLIKNGLEAARTTDSPQLHISVETSALETKISVEDNGPGISGKTDKVFRVFRSTKLHGNGLGLLISRKIVEAHSGRITVGQSSRMGGARFDIYLPNFNTQVQVAL